MEPLETPAGAGAFEPRKPFESRIRLGLIIAMIGATVVGVTSTIVQITARIAPMLDIDVGNIYEVYKYLRIPYLALTLAFVVGVFVFTKWPGPARKYATLTRGLMVSLLAVNVVYRLASPFVIEAAGFQLLAVMSFFTALAHATGIGSALFFCALIVRDRGDKSGSQTLVWLTMIVVGFDIIRALFFVSMNFLHVGGDMIYIAFNLGEVISLVLIFVVFLKTWRSLT